VEGPTNQPRSLVARSLAVVRAAVSALAIAIVPQGIWSALVGANLKATPSIPWSIPMMAGLLFIYWRYLGGAFPPHRTSANRRELLRARRVSPELFAWATVAGLLAVAALTGAWIVLAQMMRMPGNVLPPIGTTPWPIFIAFVCTGAMISPICEQAGIWGYGQVMLRRRFSATAAIGMSALIFSIAPHPPFHVALLPKIAFFFATGLIFAATAELADSILPGLLVQAIGLLTFFTIVWPNDPGRRLVSGAGPDSWFFIHLAQACLFAALAIFAFLRLNKIVEGNRRAQFR